MKVDALFAIMRPFLLGRVPAEETARSLYPDTHSGDAARVRIYATLYANNVGSALKTVYPTFQCIVTARHGEETWSAVTRAFAKAHPMTSLRWGTSPLPIFLRDEAGPALGIEPWLAEVADVELWQSRTFVAKDDEAGDGNEGNGLPGSLEIREYAYDVHRYLLKGDWTTAPLEKRSVLAFWRSHAGRVRRIALDKAALLILGAVARGEDPKSLPLSASDLRRASERLSQVELIRAPGAP